MGDAEDDAFRVALVVGPSANGVGRHVRSLVQGIAARGIRTDVYCATVTETALGFAAAGATVTPLEIGASPGPRDVATITHLRHALRSGPVDVIHAHGLRAGFVASVSRTRHTPLVVTWHQTFAEHGWARLANRGLARTVVGAAEVVLCDSRDLLVAAERLGAREARLAVVAADSPPVAERDRTQVRAELGLDPGTPLVLSAGPLHQDERHDVLISAAARWRFLRPAPSVLLAGTGPAYRDLAGQVIVARSPVLLLGQRSDLPDLLRAADIGVASSDGEAGQHFAQQALAAGLALVVAREPGLMRVVGDAAAVVPPGDVDALDSAVRSLLDDPRARARQAAAGLALAGTWPTASDAVEQAVATYAEVTGRAAVWP